MNADWRTKAVTDFCREHNVTVTIDDEWKTRQKRVILRKGNYAVVRRVCYDAIPTLLATVLLNEMLQEIPAENGGTPICTKASLASRGIYKNEEEGET